MKVSVQYSLLFSSVPCSSKRFHGLWGKIIGQVQEFNIFPSLPLATDPHVLRSQKISTWLFILLLIIAMGVLVFYNTFIPVQKTITVKQPTYDQYLSLYSTYSDNLQCPCRTVSITYKKFLQLNYTLHQTCSSFLVTEQWIQYLAATKFRIELRQDDFRAISHHAFQALRSFCQLTDDTIRNSLSSFYETQYVSAYLTASDLFRRQSEAQIEQFVSLTIKAFASSLLLIRQTTQANALMAATQTNFVLVHSSPVFIVAASALYFECACIETASCFAQTSIYEVENFTKLFVVPGFYSGCYIIESLLASDLRCFFNQQCFDSLTYYINSSLLLNATALDASLSNKFRMNSTVGEMLDALMVEQWNSSIAFATYYAECEPKECTYTIGSRNDALFIVTTVFGLVGGLVTVLRLIVPRLINRIRRKRRDKNVETGELSGTVARISYSRKSNEC